MTELSANKQKNIIRLHQKKYREEEGLFIAEGFKVIQDLMRLGCLPEYLCIQEGTKMTGINGNVEVLTMSARQAEKISLLSTPPGVLGVFKIPDYTTAIPGDTGKTDFILDRVSDPGNLGTIIRTAHWFGLTRIFITKGSVEVFSPKVVQATMGSLVSVHVHIIDEVETIAFLKEKKIPLYITDMNGLNVKNTPISSPACIVMGNESHGVSDNWRAAADGVLSIPLKAGHGRPESLNLAVSAAMMMFQVSDE